MTAVKVLAPMFTRQLVHLFSDNTTAVTIFQVGKGRDAFIQAYAREIWLTCTAWNITLPCSWPRVWYFSPGHCWCA